MPKFVKWACKKFLEGIEPPKCSSNKPKEKSKIQENIDEFKLFGN